VTDASGAHDDATNQHEVDAVADKRVEFLIEEYKSLKTEVFSLVADSRHVETFTGQPLLLSWRGWQHTRSAAR
jgi:hypothetical protein